MTAATITKMFSREFLIGLALAGIMNFAVLYAWGRTTEQDISSLKDSAATAREDHDTLIRLDANVASMKESLARIETAVGKTKEASNGN